MARHEILGGKVQLYRRTSKVWHCSASIGGVQHRASTKEDDLELAKEAAEDWYRGPLLQPSRLRSVQSGHEMLPWHSRVGFACR